MSITSGTYLLAINAPRCIDPAPGQLSILAVLQDWVSSALGQPQGCQPEQQKCQTHDDLGCQCLCGDDVGSAELRFRLRKRLFSSGTERQVKYIDTFCSRNEESSSFQCTSLDSSYSGKRSAVY